MWKQLFLFNVVFIFKVQYIDGHCIDIHSHIVSDGMQYIPGPNSCTVCMCEKGNPKYCKPVLCTQPTNCKSFQRGNSCCDFKCLDDILEGNTSYKDTYDLALPLFASVVFAIITLSLLFFVVHRFHKRKLLERHSRQINDDQRSLNSIGYIPGGLRYLPGSIGYLRSGSSNLEFHYEEATNHLALWKPPGNYFPRGEAPPPYEEAVRTQLLQNNPRMNDGNTSLENRNQNLQNIATSQIVPRPASDSLGNHQPTIINRVVRAETSTVDINESRELSRVEEYHISKGQDLQELIPLVEQTMVEINSNRLSKHEKNSGHKIKKSFQYEKVKLNENSENRKLIGKSVVCEKVNKIPSSISHSSQLGKCNDVVLNTVSQAVTKDKSTSRTLEKFNKLTQKCFEERRYENVTIPVSKKYKSIPAPLQFQNEKKEERVNKVKDKTVRNCPSEQIFLIDSKAAPFFLKDLKKSLEDCRDTSRTRTILRDTNDVPVFTVCQSKELLQENKNISLHRTLPKTLKEMVTDTKKDQDLKHLFLKTSGSHALHRSLPKFLNSCDINLPSNTEKNSYYTMKNGSSKECPLLQPVNVHSSSGSSAVHNKIISAEISRKDEQNTTTYQCLLLSQDDDDYRSECENCKAVDSAAEVEDGDVFNETMTLQRRPLEAIEEPYYPTSLTLPTQIKKPRPILQNKSRENWFRAMYHTSSSEESE